jgi:hypothetical protein
MRVPGRYGFSCVVAMMVIGISACNNDTNSTFAPTIVTPPAKTETFTGTVPVKGSDSHPFTTSNYGAMSITLTAAGPPDTIVMGVGIGAPASVTDPTCLVYQNAFQSTAAGATPQLSGNIPAGSYCVSVFDVGNQTAAVNYSVTVIHPQ